ncbi:MAG: DOMON domain-containing protein [Halobacteriota archaeon]|nr:DOMON domain-containing protein [Halobacteriota archaeon]
MSSKKYLMLIFLGLLILMAFSAPNVAGAPSEMSIPQPTIAELNGVVEDGEYLFNSSNDDGNFKIYWRLEGDTVYVAMVAKTEGWIAIGISPSSKMEPSLKMMDADIIIGWVDEDGKTTVLDSYSTGEFGPHLEDIKLGGRDDILGYAGHEEDGVTTIEFKRFLDTEDIYDVPFQSEGRVKIIWATEESDDINSTHNIRGHGTIGFSTAESTVEDASFYWQYHAAPMMIGSLLLIMGGIIARFLRGKGWWLKVHRALGVAGALISLLGFFIAFIMIFASEEMHFIVLHSYIGGVTILLVLITLIIGFLQFRLKSNISVIRRVHRWSGRITIIFMVISMISGMVQVGVL